MKTLFVSWQDPETRSWYTVARLTRADDLYRFSYTEGAKCSPRFMPFGRMKDFYKEYLATDLFPFFANRLLSQNRPEYGEFISWLNLSSGAPDPLEVLARTGGERRTDNIFIFPCPEQTEDGHYEIYFFCHGIRHMLPVARERVGEMRRGEHLFLLFDMQNPHDPSAVAIRSDDPPVMIGYCPRFFAPDLREVMKKERDKAHLQVERVNLDAPIQHRLLCLFRSPWPVDFQPCSGPEFHSLSKSAEIAA